MKRLLRHLTRPWPYETALSCMSIHLAFEDGKKHQIGWVLVDAAAAAVWFLAAHHAWEKA